VLRGQDVPVVRVGAQRAGAASRWAHRRAACASPTPVCPGPPGVALNLGHGDEVTPGDLLGLDRAPGSACAAGRVAYASGRAYELVRSIWVPSKISTAGSGTDTIP
jgi:hypothetical protein